jgi:hypothetical protein
MIAYPKCRTPQTELRSSIGKVEALCKSSEVWGYLLVLREFDDTTQTSMVLKVLIRTQWHIFLNDV